VSVTFAETSPALPREFHVFDPDGNLVSFSA
jgi:hypothetical protein